MLNQPTSSPMMTRMLGFCCANAGIVTNAKAPSSRLMHRESLEKRVMATLHGPQRPVPRHHAAGRPTLRASAILTSPRGDRELSFGLRLFLTSRLGQQYSAH